MDHARTDGLPDRQRAVLVEIIRYYQATGEVPTQRYLARRLSIHFTTVRDHLQALHRKGWLPAPVPGLVLPIPPRDEDEG